MTRDQSKAAKENKKKERQLDDQHRINTVKAVECISEREWRKLVGMYSTIDDFDPLQVVNRARVK